MKKTICLLLAVLLLILTAACGEKPETLPSSNWEGAAGYYYRDGYDVTIEVALGGTPENRTYTIIFYNDQDAPIFGLYDLSDVNGNELRANKNGVAYLLAYQPDEDAARIIITRENGEGTADYDGVYTLIMG